MQPCMYIHTYIHTYMCACVLAYIYYVHSELYGNCLQQNECIKKRSPSPPLPLQHAASTPPLQKPTRGSQGPEHRARGIPTDIQTSGLCKCIGWNPLVSSRSGRELGVTRQTGLIGVLTLSLTSLPYPSRLLNSSDWISCHAHKALDNHLLATHQERLHYQVELFTPAYYAPATSVVLVH